VRSVVADFRASEVLSVRLDMDRDSATASAEQSSPARKDDASRAMYAARFRAVRAELQRRLAAEPNVVGVTFADRLPRTNHPYHRVVVDDDGVATPDRHDVAYRVSSAAVDADYFAVLGAPIRAGRAFHSGDLGGDYEAAGARGAWDGVPGAPGEPAGAVIVNQSFVDQVLGGRNAIGRRVRYLPDEDAAPSRTSDARQTPWHEIVGVVPDLGMSVDEPKAAGIYHPLVAGVAAPVQMAVHVRGDPGSFGPMLRTIAADVDPTLRLDRIIPMDELSDAQLRFVEFWLRLTVLVSVIAVALSLTGIYAVLSFTVARRTREIGVRVALGSDARRVVAAVFRRPLIQVGLGVATGGVLAAALVFLTSGDVSPRGLALLLAYMVLMLGVCLLACIVPTWRALRVEPTVALVAEG
jgi:hypothetical protein